MTIRGNHPNIIIMDDFDEPKKEPINLNNLSAEDLEAYRRDPEAFMGWLNTVMDGGPMFTLDSLPMDLISVSNGRAISPTPDWEFHPMRDTKWVKSRRHSYGLHDDLTMAAKKRKRLKKRTNDKANRKRAHKTR